MTNRARSWVEVSLDAVTANFTLLKQAVGPAVEVMAVVKADAYNHGAAAVSAALQAAGGRYFAVAGAEEGAALREAGIGGSILLLGGVLPFEYELALNYNLTPVLHSPSELLAFEEFAARHGRRLAYHFKIDTGLGRLGSRAGAEEIAAAVRRASHCDLEGLMTHFASSENFADPSCGRQQEAFDEMRRRLGAFVTPSTRLHLSNSAAVVYGRRRAWQSMVRAGLALYGYVPPACGIPPATLEGLRPALTWKARVLAVKEMAAGSPIGYGGTFRAPANLRIAVIAAGYADGYPHCLGNRGAVVVKGRLAPVVGAVSMDLITADVTDCPAVAAGDTVTLLGGESGCVMDAVEMARRAGAIPYVILCGIGRRVARLHC